MDDLVLPIHRGAWSGDFQYIDLGPLQSVRLALQVKLSLTGYKISSCTKLQRTVINNCMTLLLRELEELNKTLLYESTISQHYSCQHYWNTRQCSYVVCN